MVGPRVQVALSSHWAGMKATSGAEGWPLCGLSLVPEPSLAGRYPWVVAQSSTFLPTSFSSWKGSQEAWWALKSPRTKVSVPVGMKLGSNRCTLLSAADWVMGGTYRLMMRSGWGWRESWMSTMVWSVVKSCGDVAERSGTE